jgi:hypothetical protein
MQAHIYPSLTALESNDEDQLAAELRLVRLRAQVAVVRTVADEIDRLARPSDVDGLGEQLIAEMARLGSQLFEAAGALKRSSSSADIEVFAAKVATVGASARRPR